MKSITDLSPTHPMRDESPEGKRLIALCTRAYEKHYDPTRQFCDLNPDVQAMWLSHAKAIVQAMGA